MRVQTRNRNKQTGLNGNMLRPMFRSMLQPMFKQGVVDSLIPKYALFINNTGISSTVSIPDKTATSISAGVDGSEVIHIKARLKISTPNFKLVYTTDSSSELTISNASLIQMTTIGGGYQSIGLPTNSIPVDELFDFEFKRYKNASNLCQIEIKINDVTVLDSTAFQTSRTVGAFSVHRLFQKSSGSAEIHYLELQGSVYINSIDDQQTTWGDGTLVSLTPPSCWALIG